ncbi:unnamed protein product, partial [Prorocentrum cordatum]
RAGRTGATVRRSRRHRLARCEEVACQAGRSLPLPKCTHCLPEPRARYSDDVSFLRSSLKDDGSVSHAPKGRLIEALRVRGSCRDLERGPRRGGKDGGPGGASGPGRAGERVPRHAAGGGGRRHRRGPALGDVSHRGAHRGGLLPRGGGARASAAARVRGGAHGRAAQGVAARPHPRPRPGAPRGGAGGRPRRSARRFRPGLAGGGGAPGRGGRGGAGRARARAAGGHHVEAGGGPQVRGGRRSSRTRVCAGSSWSTTSGSRRGRWASWRRCSSAKAPRGQRPSAGSIADARSEGDSEAAEQRVLLRRKLTAAEQELERAQEDLRASELRCEELGARAWKRRAEARELEARLEEKPEACGVA